LDLKGIPAFDIHPGKSQTYLQHILKGRTSEEITDDAEGNIERAHAEHNRSLCYLLHTHPGPALDREPSSPFSFWIDWVGANREVFSSYRRRESRKRREVGE
jgi:hypothetical protein